MDQSEFPSNAKRPAQESKNEPAKREKKVEQIVKGEVKQRKKPLGKRLTENFVQGDARNVWAYVTFDVMLPAAKDMVADAISQGVERMIFGESRSTSRRSSTRSSGVVGHTAYNSMHSSAKSHREETRNPSRHARANHDFGEIILPTRADAEEVIERLFELVDRFDEATVADLYDMVGITSAFTDEKWGWTDMRGADVRRISSGEYVLILPRTVDLK